MTQPDFSLAWEGSKGGDPWSALGVVRLNGREALSELYVYDVVVLAQADKPAVHELVGRRCAIRIATQSTPAFKVLHGVIAEANELAELPEGRTYRLRVMPPLTRSQHTKRCRIFLDRTMREIVEDVLTTHAGMERSSGESPDEDAGEPTYRPAKEAFAWRIEDASRLDDRRVRSYVVQYNESDLAFVSRLLEAEGIAYHFENGADTCLLVFSDRDSGRRRLEPDAIGAGIDGREVSSFGTGARIRARGVLLGDYNWKKPGLDMRAAAGEEEAELFEYVYPGGYPDKPAQGSPLARARAERLATEARFARGAGSLRVLSAGTVFRLEHALPRLEGEYLVTALAVEGEQAGTLKSASSSAPEPFRVRFECARRGAGAQVKESGFRPRLATPAPRIRGAQTAVVTAEPSAKGSEIHVGGPDGIDIGCVRLRFHWDKDEARLSKEPSSTWVRVSQPFAGAGQGGVWHARVGTEVIVDFEEGDPDRPVVVGRVYNGQNRPHRGGSPTISTFKSNASPGGAVHNELTFDDTAGSELIYTNAGKDMATDVGANRSETIASNAQMNVGANDTEQIGANCTVTIGANDMLTIGANDTTMVGGNSATMIGSNCLTVVGGSETHVVGVNQLITIGATHTEVVGAAVTETYGATRATNVAGAESETIGGNRTTTIAGAHTQKVGALQAKLVGGSRTIQCTTLTTSVGAAAIELVGGPITTNVSAAQTWNAGGGFVFLAPSFVNQDAATHADLDANATSITGVGITLGLMAAEAAGAGISVVGVAAEATGISQALHAIEIMTAGVRAFANGAELKANGYRNRVGLIIEL